MQLWLQFQASPKHRVHLQTRCVNAACGAAGAIQEKRVTAHRHKKLCRCEAMGCELF